MNTARIIFALLTWLTIWGFSGGDMELFWLRLPQLTLWVYIIAAITFYLYPLENFKLRKVTLPSSDFRRSWFFEAPILSPSLSGGATRAFTTSSTASSARSTAMLTRKSFSEALQNRWLAMPLSALAAALTFTWFYSKGSTTIDWVSFGVETFATQDTIRVLTLILLLSGYSFLLHSVLQREWGAGNTVFLMSIIAGFASQQLAIFIFALLTSSLFAYVSQRSNLITGLCSGILWMTMFVILIGFF